MSPITSDQYVLQRLEQLFARVRTIESATIGNQPAGVATPGPTPPIDRYIGKYTSANRPTAKLTYLGYYLLLADEGVPSRIQFCVLNSDGSYTWSTAATGLW